MLKGPSFDYERKNPVDVYLILYAPHMEATKHISPHLRICVCILWSNRVKVVIHSPVACSGSGLGWHGPPLKSDWPPQYMIGYMPSQRRATPGVTPIKNVWTRPCHSLKNLRNCFEGFNPLKCWSVYPFDMLNSLNCIAALCYYAESISISPCTCHC